MFPLSLGMCGDLFVVVRKVTDSVAFALTASVLLLFVFYGLWFGYTFYHRSQSRRRAQLRESPIG